MAKPFITIIGLGVTGTSVGLALRKEPGDFEVVGHDKEHAADGAARKRNAVHRGEWNLHRACEGASMIILAIPMNEIAETLQLIAEDLTPNCLVLVLNSLMQPTVELAGQALPKHANVVVGHPILIGGASIEPHAELLHEATFCLAAAPQTGPGALELASDFVERIGAKPHFVDALEHDGIMAGVEQLPTLLGATLMHMCARSPGWRESQQLAGQRFAQTTSIGNNAASLFRALYDNRENLLRRIGQFQAELEAWRELLSEETPSDKPHRLLDVLNAAVAERGSWAQVVITQEWDKVSAPMPQPESSGGVFRQLFLGNWGRRGSRSDQPDAK
jgi:prephenate dehydrogenase